MLTCLAITKFITCPLKFSCLDWIPKESDFQLDIDSRVSTPILIRPDDDFMPSENKYSENYFSISKFFWERCLIFQDDVQNLNQMCPLNAYWDQISDQNLAIDTVDTKYKGYIIRPKVKIFVVVETFDLRLNIILVIRLRVL